MKNAKTLRTQTLTRLALLAALTVLLANLPIKFGIIEMTLGVIPVAIGAVVMGPLSGLILGLVLGLASFLQCLGVFVPSLFGATILGMNPLYTVLICFVSRALMGWLTGVIFKALKAKIEKPGCYIAALCAALLNTVFFVGMVILFFWNTAYIQETLGANGKSFLLFAVLFAGWNALVEAVVTCLVGGAVSHAMTRIFKQV